MEELDYNLLFRWFVGLNMDDPVWDATLYCKNRERLLKGEVADAFFKGVLQLAKEHHLLSDEHFTVDGTLIEAWASLKSFKKKDTEQTTPPRSVQKLKTAVVVSESRGSMVCGHKSFHSFS
jgi:transposase